MKNNMKIIMICGKARSGKDTLADFLIKHLTEKEANPCRIQIAQYIKYYAMKYFGWNGEEETKPRDLLNKIGTDIIRNKINPNFHTDRLIEDIKILSYFYDTFVISDVRLPEEIKQIKKAFDNVTTIKLTRESDELNEQQLKHMTETAFDNYNNFDYIIDNNGTLEELEQKSKQIINKVI